jgi:predicted nucleic acid-binding protein
LIFCDTSALAKYYVPENESAALRLRLDSENAVIASELARVELMSVFHRRMRERKWTREQFQAATSQFNRNEAAKFWTWVPVSSFILGAASQLYLSLPGNVFLRANHCLHLVTALHHRFEEVCTFDRHQQKAVQVLGLTVIKL